MWYGYKRNVHLNRLNDEFDIVVIGGGVTGAGILQQALKLGYKCCLIEKNDFVSGTSSCSSKMVHGGLRYLKEGDFYLTYESVTERELILSQAKYLVNRMDYIMPIYKDKRLIKYGIPIFLKIYDLFAILGDKDKKLRFKTKSLTKRQVKDIFPNIRSDDLIGGAKFEDSLTDDSRLVLSILREALSFGGIIANYCEAVDFIKNKHGIVKGIIARDRETNTDIEIRAKVVISAVGAWSKNISNIFGIPLKLRPLRGSHIIVPQEKISVKKCIAALHPQDSRPLFVFPWEGETVIGTTDLDHTEDMDKIPRISEMELDYLLHFANYLFPDAKINPDHIISSYAGVRPIISAGQKLPSKEPRKHTVIENNGLVMVVGGKLTTFRKIALDTIKHALKYLPAPTYCINLKEIFTNIIWYTKSFLDEEMEKILVARYGIDAPYFFKELKKDECGKIYDKRILAEIRWALRHEGVVHLDDLMLRRTRIGLILPKGGKEILDHIESMAKEELGWDDKKWNQEKDRYMKIWKQAHFCGTN